jgi:hypothetical protein
MSHRTAVATSRTSQSRGRGGYTVVRSRGLGQSHLTAVDDPLHKAHLQEDRYRSEEECQHLSGQKRHHGVPDAADTP